MPSLPIPSRSREGGIYHIYTRFETRKSTVLSDSKDRGLFISFHHISWNVYNKYQRRGFGHMELTSNFSRFNYP